MSGFSIEKLLMMRTAELATMGAAVYFHRTVPHIHVSFQDIPKHYNETIDNLARLAGVEVTHEAEIAIGKMYQEGYSSWGKKRGDPIP